MKRHPGNPSKRARGKRRLADGPQPISPIDTETTNMTPMTRTAQTTLPEGLTVTGEATRNATPEMVEVCFEVHGAGPNAPMALQDTVIRAGHISQALIASGIDQADIQAGIPTLWTILQSAGPALSPGLPLLPPVFPGQGIIPQFMPAGPEGLQLTGYRALNSIQVMVRDASRLGECIEAATRAGAILSSSGFLFRLRDERALRNTLLEEAVRQARDSADALASSLGKG